MILTESAFGPIPDIGLISSLPPTALLTPDNVHDAGLFTKRHQDSLRMVGKLRYRKLNGRVRYYAGEFVDDFFRITGAPEFSDPETADK